MIWVEGPSDRTYLRSWIEHLDPRLQEGIHYSIMFYGGALLAHLSAEDPAVEVFVALPRINRNFHVVIDSDRNSAEVEVNATKQRIQAEVDAATGVESVWITSGYTIENYVPVDLLCESLAAVHPGVTTTWSGDQFVSPLGKDQIEGREYPVDKPAIAREVVSGLSDDWPLDLKERVSQIVASIREANDLG